MGLNNYTPDTTGIATSQLIEANHLTDNFTSIQTSINNSNTEVLQTIKFKEAYETTDYIRSFNTASLTFETNSITIGINAVVIWDDSSGLEVSGWATKTFSSLTNSTNYYLWCTFVSGVKDYEISATGVSLPTNLTEKYCLGIITVDGSGVVSFLPIFSLPHNNRTQIFRDEVFFLGNVYTKGNFSERLPKGYSKLYCTYTNANSITITAGSRFRDSTDTINIVFNSNLVVNLTVSGAGGLDTGTEAINTWYYLYAIYNPTTNATSAVLSAVNEKSSGTITLPSGYTIKRQLPIAVRNDGSSDILPFYFYNNEVVYQVHQSVLSGGSSATYTNVSYASVVPPLSRLAKTNYSVAFGEASTKSAFIREDGTTAVGIALGKGNSTLKYAYGQVEHMLSTSQIAEYSVEDTDNELYLGCTSYKIENPELL